MTILIILGIIALVVFFVWAAERPMSESELAAYDGGPKPGRYTNRKGKHYTINSDGSMSVDVGKLLSSPKVQKQLDGFHRLYMQQTLMALHNGEEPPNSVGGHGVLTKKKLMSVWDDEWQAELDNMNEYYDVTYNSFFGVQEEHPETGIILTAEEILAEYGEEKES